MEVSELKKGDVVIIGLKGRLDANTSNSFQDKLLTIIDGGDKLIAIDFSQLDYISSAGLRVLLMALKKLKNVNGKLVLFTLQDHIREVFDLAGFYPMFPIVDTQEDALKKI